MKYLDQSRYITNEGIRKDPNTHFEEVIVVYACKWAQNALRTHDKRISTVSVGIHSGWQKKSWKTKEKMQRQSPINWEQASMAHTTWLTIILKMMMIMIMIMMMIP